MLPFQNLPGDLDERIGASHVAGLYNFTNGDFLNEGADLLLEMGSKIIKLWFTPTPEKNYPFNSVWENPQSLMALAESNYYKNVFNKPFKVFLLETFLPQSTCLDFNKGFSDEDLQRESDGMRAIASYFLREYAGSGKTFVFQNWESDWLLTNPDFSKEYSDNEIKAMISWLNARQDGVSRAREEIGMNNVVVANAAEVNLVARGMDGLPSAVNDVLPHTNCDLYSYSAYDTCVFQPDRFRDALKHIESNAPESKIFGRRNIFVGEFGAPENEFSQLDIVKKTVEESLEFGARWIVYWQTYCNEPSQTKINGRPRNDDCRGFWLVRPDGSKSPAWNYFKSLLS